MIHKLTSKAYAQSIYTLTSQQNFVLEIIGDLKIVDEKFTESPSFYLHLKDPQLTLLEKEKNLKDVFADFISHKTYKIITLLIKNKHLNWLKKIIVELEKVRKEKEEIVDAKIFTPANLLDEQKAKIKSILSDKIKKTIIIHEIIKPELIGGIKIDVNGLVIDGTIFGKLEQLNRNIKNLA